MRDRALRRWPWWCAGLVSIAVLATTRQGIGISPDSVSYLSAGANLADGEGLRGLDGALLTLFPPGLPVIVALFEWIGVSASAALRVLFALCAAATVLLTARHARHMTQSVALRVGAVALVAVAPVVLNVSKMAWSEPLFIVIALGFLLIAAGVVDRRAITWPEVVALSVLTALGFFVRYAGASLGFVGVACLVITLRGRPIGYIAARVGVYALCSSAAPLAWVARNRRADGSWFGPRAESRDSVSDVAEQVLSTFGDWVLPGERLPERVLVVLGIVAVTVLAAAGWWAVQSGGHSVAARPEASVGLTGHVTVHLLFIVVTIGSISAAQLSTLFDPINSRLLSPVFPSVVLLGAVLAERVYRKASVLTPRASWVQIAGVAFLVGQGAATLVYVTDGVRNGVGLNEPAVVDSPLAAAVQRLPDAGRPTIYTNRPASLWTATMLQPLRQSPLLVGGRGQATPEAMIRFAGEVACSTGPVHLALYQAIYAGEAIADDFSAVVDLTLVGTLDDGALFRVEPLGGAAECGQP